MLNGKPLLSFPSVVVSKNGTTTMVVASATLIIEPSTKTINPTKRAVLISHPPRGKLTGTSIQILGVGLPRHLSCGLRVCLALTDEEQGFGCLSIRRVTPLAGEGRWGPVRRKPDLSRRHVAGVLPVHHTRSTARLTASPPPRQTAATPRRTSRSCMALSSVVRIRAPLAPIGCPNATAP